MTRNFILSSLLALVGACAVEPESTREVQAVVADSCSGHLGATDITNNESSILVGGDAAVSISCTDYNDPRINGSAADLEAYLEEKCTISFSALPTNADCDPNAPPVVINETESTITIRRCVSECTEMPYTAEGGTFIDLPPGVTTYDYLCDQSGPYAGCCDYFNAAPAELNGCDRTYNYDPASSTWIQTGGAQAVLAQIAAPRAEATFPLGTSSVQTSAAIDPPATPPPGGGTQPPTQPGGTQGTTVKKVRDTIAALIIAFTPQHSEVGEKLGQILEQIHGYIERKEKQKEQTQVLPKPPPIVAPAPKPPQPGILVPTRPGMPGANPPVRPPVQPLKPTLPGPKPTPPMPPKPPIKPPGKG